MAWRLLAVLLVLTGTAWPAPIVVTCYDGSSSASVRWLPTPRTVRRASRLSCVPFGDWACPRRLRTRACPSAALASPAAAGESGVIPTEHSRIRFATQDVLGRAPS